MGETLVFNIKTFLLTKKSHYKYIKKLFIHIICKLSLINWVCIIRLFIVFLNKINKNQVIAQKKLDKINYQITNSNP